jgi:hypothetical protein
MIHQLIKELPTTGSMMLKPDTLEAVSLVQELEKMGFRIDKTPSLLTNYNCIKWYTTDSKGVYKSYHWTQRWTVQVSIPTLGGGTHKVSVPDTDLYENEVLDFDTHFQLKHQYRGYRMKRFGV